MRASELSSAAMIDHAGMRSWWSGPSVLASVDSCPTLDAKLNHSKLQLLCAKHNPLRDQSSIFLQDSYLRREPAVADHPTTQRSAMN